jgi:acyl-CoA thioesterase FadM
MIIRIDLHRDEEILVEGTLRYVCVDTESWRKTAVPDWIREGLEAFSTPPSGRRTPSAP